MTSARPRIVNRLELDIELKAVWQRLDEVAARVHRQAPLLSSMEIRLEELVDRCGGEAKVGRLASQADLAALEMRCQQRISSESINLTADLEDFAGRVALKGTVEDLQIQHAAQVDALSCDISALQAGLVHASSEQLEFSTFARDTYLCKKDHEDDCTSLCANQTLSEERFVEAAGRLEVTQQELQALVLQTQQLRTQLEKHEIVEKVQAKSLQNLESDIASLKHRMQDDLAPKSSISQVFEMASESHTKLDFAMMDRANIRQRMEEELDGIKKTLYRQQSTFQLMDFAVESVNGQDKKLLKFQELLETRRSEHQELAAKVQQQERRLGEFQSKLQKDLRTEEDLRAGLQQQVQEQVSRCQATADSLSTCSTRISLEHMEKSLALRQSLDELSLDHRQLKSQILSTDQVRATRGEDGAWQVMRSPA